MVRSCNLYTSGVAYPRQAQEGEGATHGRHEASGCVRGSGVPVPRRGSATSLPRVPAERVPAFFVLARHLDPPAAPGLFELRS